LTDFCLPSSSEKNGFSVLDVSVETVRRENPVDRLVMGVLEEMDMLLLPALSNTAGAGISTYGLTKPESGLGSKFCGTDEGTGLRRLSELLEDRLRLTPLSFDA
jgi:hypothetical protein